MPGFGAGDVGQLCNIPAVSGGCKCPSLKGDQYVAIITDTRDDKPLGRAQHIEAGTRVAVPNSKIKWGSGNPTGHGIIFIGIGGDVFCYLPPGGG